MGHGGHGPGAMGGEGRKLTLPVAAVLPAGAWGTALATVLARNGWQVKLWAHSHSAWQVLQEEQRSPGLPVRLPASVHPCRELEVAVDGCSLVVLAPPTQKLRELARRLAPHLGRDVITVCGSKGMEAGSGLLPSQVLREEWGRRPLVVLSGPNFSAEVARGLPTATVAASHSPRAARVVQKAFFNSRFRVYTSSDLFGVQLGGALKNVLAIAAGMCDGLEMGHNARAALITRGLAEITRLGMALGARPLTFAGLSGLGDLVLTCTGDLSRNRRAGLALATGKEVPQVLAELGTVEGYHTARAAVELGARLRLELPVCEQVYLVLYRAKPVREVVDALMGRPPRPES